jgi:hypothetical protein
MREVNFNISTLSPLETVHLLASEDLLLPINTYELRSTLTQQEIQSKAESSLLLNNHQFLQISMISANWKLSD